VVDVDGAERWLHVVLQAKPLPAEHCRGQRKSAVDVSQKPRWAAVKMEGAKQQASTAGLPVGPAELTFGSGRLWRLGGEQSGEGAGARARARAQPACAQLSAVCVAAQAGKSYCACQRSHQCPSNQHCRKRQRRQACVLCLVSWRGATCCPTLPWLASASQGFTYSAAGMAHPPALLGESPSCSRPGVALADMTSGGKSSLGSGTSSGATPASHTCAGQRAGSHAAACC
jgi:hypothetical protein